jgi:hypothetical protein
MCSASVLAQLVRALGKIHFTLGRSEGKKAPDESWDSKSSEAKVGAGEPRPWRRMMVCVRVEEGGMVWQAGWGVILVRGRWGWRVMWV